MPTPNDETFHIQSVSDPHAERPMHTTCPPDTERVNVWRIQDDDVIAREDSSVEAAHEMQRTASANASASDLGRTETQHTQQAHTKQMDIEDAAGSPDGMSLWGLSPESKESDQRQSPVPTSPPAAAYSSSSSMRYEFSNIRVRSIRTMASLYAS
jgi:hypothetical protein